MSMRAPQPLSMACYLSKFLKNEILFAICGQFHKHLMLVAYSLGKITSTVSLMHAFKVH